MARNMNRKTIEQKIAKTERAISRNREQYDRLTAELEDLHKKKKAILNEEILKAIAGSEKAMRRSSVLYKEKRIPTVERKNDMEKQEQEERKHIEALDRKIERLQEKVIKKHKEYSVLAEELSTLLDERHPERKIERAKQALYDVYVESERSLDEIIDLIRNADEWI